MKKALLSTTALIAGGLIAGSVMAADLEPAPLPAPVDEGFTVEVGGAAFAGFFYLDESGTANPDQTLVPWTGEIHFDASTTLANGITVAVRVELEAFSTGPVSYNGDDQIDEHYITISGNFGQIKIGAEDAASNLVKVGVPSAGALDLDGATFQTTIVDGGMDQVLENFSSDANKVIYITPRISGFQAGVSYAPNDADGGGVDLALRNTVAAVRARNIFSAAATYQNTFNNVSVAFGAGVETGKTNAWGRRTTWDVGGSLGFAGFTIGGNYSRSKNGVALGSKRKVWMVGGTYGTGPWTVGLGYLRGKANAAGGVALGITKFTQWNAGASYALGTGVTLTADIIREKNNAGQKGILAGVGIATAF